MNRIFNIIDGPLSIIYLFLDKYDIYLYKLKYVNTITREVVVRTMNFRNCKSDLCFRILAPTNSNYSTENCYDLRYLSLNISFMRDMITNGYCDNHIVQKYIFKICFSCKNDRDIYVDTYDLKFANKKLYDGHFSLKMYRIYEDLKIYSATTINRKIKQLVHFALTNMKKLESEYIQLKLYVVYLMYKKKKLISENRDKIIDITIAKKISFYIDMYIFHIICYSDLENFIYVLDRYKSEFPEFFNKKRIIEIIDNLINRKLVGHIRYMHMNFEIDVNKCSIYDYWHRDVYKVSNTQNMFFLIENKYFGPLDKINYHTIFDGSVKNKNMKLFQFAFDSLIKTINSDNQRSLLSTFLLLFNSLDNAEYIKYIFDNCEFIRNKINPRHIYLWAAENGIRSYIIKYGKYAMSPKYVDIPKYFDHYFY